MDPRGEKNEQLRPEDTHRWTSANREDRLWLFKNKIQLGQQAEQAAIAHFLGHFPLQMIGQPGKKNEETETGVTPPLLWHSKEFGRRIHSGDSRVQLGDFIHEMVRTLLQHFCSRFCMIQKLVQEASQLLRELLCDLQPQHPHGGVTNLMETVHRSSTRNSARHSQRRECDTTEGRQTSASSGERSSSGKIFRRNATANSVTLTA